MYWIRGSGLWRPEVVLDPRLKTRRQWAKLSFLTLICTIPSCVLLSFIGNEEQIARLASLAFIIVPVIAGLVWIVHEYFRHCMMYDHREEDRSAT